MMGYIDGVWEKSDAPFFADALGEGYKDMDGNPITLYRLVRESPEWAEAQLRDQRRELAALVLRLETAETAVVQKDRGIDTWALMVGDRDRLIASRDQTVSELVHENGILAATITRLRTALAGWWDSPWTSDEINGVKWASLKQYLWILLGEQTEAALAYPKDDCLAAERDEALTDLVRESERLGLYDDPKDMDVLDQIHAAHIDITSGMSSEEYVRKLREDSVE